MKLGRSLPERLVALHELAFDLRWTWSHEADALWQRVDRTTWQRTRNPWTVLNATTGERFEALTADREFLADLDRWQAARQAYLSHVGWFARHPQTETLPAVAWFSMEFGLGDALPLYAGGLGVLAGDFLKSASDLGMPTIGVGLLYRHGYFRQILDAAGRQHEAYPANDPADMPIEAMHSADGCRVRVSLSLPGRTVWLRVWRAIVGRTKLYLLDSNDPENGPVDRGITGSLYGGGTENRLLQEIALGVGGWKLIADLHPEVEICHLNEGHAAFAVLERIRLFAEAHNLTFAEALWATRAGNVFTTHTPTAAAFDRYPIQLLRLYGQAWLQSLNAETRLSRQLKPDHIIALGREASGQYFNMAYLACRGSAHCFGVSRLHGAVSRWIFRDLFQRWPIDEVPFQHVTNGVHVPSWDSAAADTLWTAACGKMRWRDAAEDACGLVEKIDDETLWTARAAARAELVHKVRARLRTHLSGRGMQEDIVRQADTVLDPNVLTIGLARRFTNYKRPDLLLWDRARLERLLTHDVRPLQLVLAGKAHPDDEGGKRAIQAWHGFAQETRNRRRVVFLEDYDIGLAQDLVQGVDLWINTPRRPWEACGTSGMKVLVNGGLNLSTLDGWWDEAYAPDVGWAIGQRDGTNATVLNDGDADNTAARDNADAEELMALLETIIVPEFYQRDAKGIPRAWVARMRRSMTTLTLRFSATRMVQDYVDQAYSPAAQMLRARVTDNTRLARRMAAWAERVTRQWPDIHIGQPSLAATEDGPAMSVPIYLGELTLSDVRVEAYAEAMSADGPEAAVLHPVEGVSGAIGGHVFVGPISTKRPLNDYTVRVMPSFAGIRVPAEIGLIRWGQ